MSIRARLASSATLVLVGVLATIAPASADEGRLLVDVPGDGHGFVHTTSAPLLHFDRLAPGSSTSGTLEVDNATSGPVSLALAATDVVQSENGCLPQEVRSGDTTCRGGEGELLGSLEMTVTDLTGGRDATLWSGPMADLGQPVRLLDRLAAGRTLSVRLSVEMLRRAGNETSTDSVSFGLRWSASGDRGASDAEVLGVSALAKGSGTPGTSASGDTTGGRTPGASASDDAKVLGESAFAKRGRARDISASRDVGGPGSGDGVPIWLVIADVLLALTLAGLVCGRALFALGERRRADRELEEP